MLASLRHRVRQDTLPILLYMLTFVVMSYPFVFNMGSHLPLENVDTHQALWQYWWVHEALTQGFNVNDVPILFYPNGLDYTLLPPRWSSIPLWFPLYELFGDPLAYNLTLSINILLKAYGMYLVGLMLFKKRIPAWVTGAFYAFAATSLQMALQQPLTGGTEWIPWFMLVYMYGIVQLRTAKNPRRLTWVMIIAGFFFSLNAYANLKVAIFAMLLGGGYVLFQMLYHHLYRLPRFWISMVVFALSAIGFSIPILIPVILSFNIESATGDGVVLRGGIDMLSFLRPELKRPFNYMQSIASLRGEQLELQNIWGMSHVGIVSLAFALRGIVYGVRKQRQIMIWAILALIFWSLSLGLVINIKFEPLGIYWTPYRLLEDNIIFTIIKWPFRMSLVFLFPFSILIGYGLHSRLKGLSLNWKQTSLMVISVVMLLYGTSIFPIPTRPDPRPAYIDVLADLPDGAVIDLPFGRHNSKYYMSIQRFHQRPMIEGMIARPLPDDYAYIDDNPLLGVFREGEPSVIADDTWDTALQGLYDDGFRYILLHKFVPQTTFRIERPDDWIIDLFALYEPIYEDEQVLIYPIDQLNNP